MDGPSFFFGKRRGVVQLHAIKYIISRKYGLYPQH